MNLSPKFYHTFGLHIFSYWTVIIVCCSFCLVLQTTSKSIFSWKCQSRLSSDACIPDTILLLQHHSPTRQRWRTSSVLFWYPCMGHSQAILLLFHSFYYFFANSQSSSRWWMPDTSEISAALMASEAEKEFTVLSCTSTTSASCQFYTNLRANVIHFGWFAIYWLSFKQPSASLRFSCCYFVNIFFASIAVIYMAPCVICSG